jgi:hypothetical protein
VIFLVANLCHLAKIINWKRNILSQILWFWKRNAKNIYIKKIRIYRVLKIFLLSYFEYRQIWLNILMDNCQCSSKIFSNLFKVSKKCSKISLPPPKKKTGNLWYFWLYTKNQPNIEVWWKPPKSCHFRIFKFNFLAKFRQYSKSCQSESLVQRFFLWLNSGTWLFFSKWLKICVCVCVYKFFD